jgi:hypothetical protein
VKSFIHLLTSKKRQSELKWNKLASHYSSYTRAKHERNELRDRKGFSIIDVLLLSNFILSDDPNFIGESVKKGAKTRAYTFGSASREFIALVALTSDDGSRLLTSARKGCVRLSFEIITGTGERKATGGSFVYLCSAPSTMFPPQRQQQQRRWRSEESELYEMPSDFPLVFFTISKT